MFQLTRYKYSIFLFLFIPSLCTRYCKKFHFFPLSNYSRAVRLCPNVWKASAALFQTPLIWPLPYSKRLVSLPRMSRFFLRLIHRCSKEHRVRLLNIFIYTLNLCISAKSRQFVKYFNRQYTVYTVYERQGRLHKTQGIWNLGDTDLSEKIPPLCSGTSVYSVLDHSKLISAMR